jgi:hypothetical protein
MTRKTRAEALKGVADESLFLTTTGNGSVVDPSGVVFPILRQFPDKRVELAGTGFFVAKGGIFITARHVAELILDANRQPTYGLGIIQLMPGGVFVERPVRKVILNDHVDIAIGVCAEMKSQSNGEILDNRILQLTARDPAVGENVFTYAYPDTVTVPNSSRTEVHVNPHYYQGKIEEHFPVKRDSIVLTWPCFQTSMHLHGGASGGPVFDSRGRVFGINTMSMDPHTDISYVTKVSEALSLVIDGIIIPPATAPAQYSLAQLAELGFASVSK